MPGTASRACTRCISDVPGLAKHTSIPAETNDRTRLSAPFIDLHPSCIGAAEISSAADGSAIWRDWVYDRETVCLHFAAASVSKCSTQIELVLNRRSNNRHEEAACRGTTSSRNTYMRSQRASASSTRR